MHEPFNYRIASSDLREAIWVAFKQANIVISYPQIDVHFPQSVAQNLFGSSSSAGGALGQRRP